MSARVGMRSGLSFLPICFSMNRSCRVWRGVTKVIASPSAAHPAGAADPMDVGVGVVRHVVVEDVGDVRNV